MTFIGNPQTTFKFQETSRRLLIIWVTLFNRGDIKDLYSANKKLAAQMDSIDWDDNFSDRNSCKPADLSIA